MSLELLVLGSGGPFANPRRASSGCLVTTRARRLLVDAGGGVFVLLGEQGVDPGRLDAILRAATSIPARGASRSCSSARTAPGATCTRSTASRSRRASCRATRGRRGSRSSTTESRRSTRPRSRTGRCRRSPTASTTGRARSSSRATPRATSRSSSSWRAAAARSSPTSPCRSARPSHGHLHPKPSEVARLAADAGAARLVLTHVMPEHEDELDASLALVRERYDGEVVLAHDGLRLEV